MDKKYTWLKIADSLSAIQFSAEGLSEVKAGGKTFCIALVKDELFACAATCPHAGGILSEGYIDAVGNIVCPVHRYKYNLMNGRNSSGEGYFLKTFPVEKREDGIFVGIEETGLFSWLK